MSHTTTFPCEIKIMILAMLVSLLAGCATMRYGGAPEPTSNLNTDIDELSQHFGLSTSISGYYSKKTQNARDEFIVGRLTLMNLRYLKFIRNLTSERQLLDSATAITAMGLGLAGSMVPLALTTKILAAVSAGVAGTKEVIDKNYYFEKTIPALVAQMNAERQKALTPILEGMQHDIVQYPFEKAVVDLNNYYVAGTFAGAIQAIQADASVTESKKKIENAKIAKIVPLSGDAVKRKKSLNKAIGLLNKPDSMEVKQKNLEKINRVIITLHGSPSSSFDDAMDKLIDLVTEATRTEAGIKDVEDAFEQAGIILVGQ